MSTTAVHSVADVSSESLCRSVVASSCTTLFKCTLTSDAALQRK